MRCMLAKWLVGSMVLGLAPIAANLPIVFSPPHSLGTPTFTGTVVFDTDPVTGGSPFGTGRVVTVWQNGHPPGVQVRVFDFNSILIPVGATVRGVGPAPLVLTSGGTITIHGTIDVSGAAGSPRSNGGAGGGGAGGAVALFASGQITIGVQGRILAEGGDGGISGVGGSGAGGAGGPGGGGGGDGGPTIAGGAGGRGGSGGFIGSGGGGGGGGAFSGPRGNGGAGGTFGSDGFAGVNGDAGACPDLEPGGRGGSGGFDQFLIAAPGGAAGAPPGGNGGTGVNGGFRGGGGGGGGGATEGGAGGTPGTGGRLGGGGGGGGGGADCWGGSVPPGKGKPGGGGGGGGKDGGNGGVVSLPPEPNGGAGGGGCVNLGSVVNLVTNNGLISLEGGDNDGFPPAEGGLGVLLVYGSLGGSGFVVGTIQSSSGDVAADWILTGGGGGGGGGGNGMDTLLTVPVPSVAPLHLALLVGAVALAGWWFSRRRA